MRTSARTLLLTLAAAAIAAGTAAAADAPTVVARINVSPAAAPCAAAGGGGAVWVAEYGQPYLLKIDPKRNRIVRRYPVGVGACGLRYGAGSLWVEDTASNTVSRVNARTGQRVAIKVDLTPYDSIYAYGAAWATSNLGGKLDRIDPKRNRVSRRWNLPGASGVVAAFGSIWATGLDGVIRVDPATGAVTARIAVGGATWTAASSNAVWVTTPSGIVRIDPAANAVAATVPLPSDTHYGDPDVIAGRVWVPLIQESRIALVDPATNTVVQTIKAGTGPFVVTQINGEAWVPSWKGHDIWRFRP